MGVSGLVDAKARRTFAAVDLGSNSFHMLVARQDGDDLRVIDRLREPVRLGAGFDAKGRLNKNIRERALDCLGRFGQRVGDLPPGSVRAVGTNALRKARDSHEFLQQARQALGHDIDIISGIEEARLIYAGVARSLAADGHRRLVIDIGGGSTEIIIGRDAEPQALESLHMGCVSITEAYFTKQVATRKAMKKAQLHVCQQLEPVEKGFRRMGWEEAVGASGSVRTLANLCREITGEDGMTPDSLGRLEARLVELGDFERFCELGISRDRAEVLAGGLCVLRGVMATLQIERLRVADGALREGLLVDLIGRLEQRDIRDHTVNALMERYRVDALHAARVAGSAAALADEFGPGWVSGDEGRRLIVWAAKLCDVGLSISHSSFHKHGAYILAHADLAGFSRREQRLLSILVRAHRRKIPRHEFCALSDPWAERVISMVIVLRLAILLNRSRSDEVTPIPRVKVNGDSVRLGFPDGWLDEHPLTLADLEEESRYLDAAGISLRYA